MRPKRFYSAVLVSDDLLNETKDLTLKAKAKAKAKDRTFEGLKHELDI